MALLDAFDTEQGRFGLGLLAMAQPSRMSDGERMLGALQMLDSFKAQRSAAEERKADREERARVRMLQEQQIQMQLEEARRRRAEQLDAAARRDAYLASIAGPGDGVGPTMPLDPAAALRAGLSADEQKLFNPQQQRKVKSIETLAGPNGQPVPVAVYEDGSTAILPFGAKPEPAQKPRVPDPASDLLIPGPNGTLVPNTALIDIKKQLQPPGINVSYGSLVPVIGPDGQPAIAQPSNRGGAQIVPGMKPMPPGKGNVPAEIRRMDIAATTMGNLLNEYEAFLKTNNPRDPLVQMNSAKRADAQSLLKNIQLQFKELQGLGALAGPDLSIMEAAITDPFTFKGAYYGSGGLLAQIGRARQLIEERRRAMQADAGAAADQPAAPAVDLQSLAREELRRRGIK